MDSQFENNASMMIRTNMVQANINNSSWKGIVKNLNRSKSVEAKK